MENQGLITNHYALLVESIDATVGRFESDLGLRFDTPVRIPFEIEGHGEQYAQEVRACFDADHRVELIEPHERGPFAPSPGPGMHHFGGVVPDLADRVERQRTAGNEVDWELSYDGQLVAVFFTGGGDLPGRLELVNGQAPPLLEMFAESR